MEQKQANVEKTKILKKFEVRKLKYVEIGD